MSIEYTIICDGCAGLIDARSTNAAEARISIRKSGGKTNLPGGKDLCWRCVEAGIGVDGLLRKSADSETGAER